MCKTAFSKICSLLMVVFDMIKPHMGFDMFVELHTNTARKPDAALLKTSII